MLAICEYLLPSTTSSLRLPAPSVSDAVQPRASIRAETRPRATARTGTDLTPARGGNCGGDEARTRRGSCTAFASRASGRGGGTTLPGRVLTALAPDAPRRLAAAAAARQRARLGDERQDDHVRDGRGDPRGRCGWPRNTAGANLALRHRRGAGGARGAPAELGLFECDEAALPAIVRRSGRNAMALGNLFRDQLDRYGELEAVAERWRELLAELAPGDDARRRAPTIR